MGKKSKIKRGCPICESSNYSEDKSGKQKSLNINPKDEKKLQEIVNSCENEQVLSENLQYLEMKRTRKNFKRFSLLMVANALHEKRFFHEAIFWFEEYFDLTTNRKEQLWTSEDFDKLFTLYYDFGNAEMVIKMSELLKKRMSNERKIFSNYEYDRLNQMIGNAGLQLKNYEITLESFKNILHIIEYIKAPQWKFKKAGFNTRELMDCYIDLISVLLKTKDAETALNHFQSGIMSLGPKGLNSHRSIDIELKTEERVLHNITIKAKSVIFEAYIIRFKAAQLCLLKAKTYKILKMTPRYHEWVLMARRYLTSLMKYHDKFPCKDFEDLVMTFIDVNLKLKFENEIKMTKKANHELFQEDLKENGLSYQRLWRFLCSSDISELIQYECLQKSMKRYDIPVKMLLRFLDYIVAKFEENADIEGTKKAMNFKNSILINTNISINIGNDLKYEIQ